MTFTEIFKMVKGAVNASTYSGCSNDEILKAATQIYCKQMEVESVIRKSNFKETAQNCSTETVGLSHGLQSRI